MTMNDARKVDAQFGAVVLPPGAGQNLRRRIYLAGPFTSVAQRCSSVEGVASEIIGPDSPWRRTLEATERALSSKGWGVFLPHRDVSTWGHRDVSPEQIACECLEAVLGSDCVMAVLAESFGTHVEVGTAIGRGIPTIVIEAEDEGISFFGKAVAACDMVASIRVKNLKDLPDMVSDQGFDDAVRSAFARRACGAYRHTRQDGHA